MEQAALIPSPNNLEDHSKALITPLPPISHEEPNATSPAGDFVIDTPPARAHDGAKPRATYKAWSQFYSQLTPSFDPSSESLGVSRNHKEKGHNPLCS